MSRAFTPFEISHDAPKLTPAEASLPGSFEWWYFDLQTEDGVSLVVLFSRRNPVLVDRRPSVYVEFKDEAGGFTRVRNYAESSFRWVDEPGERALHIDRHSVRLEGDDPASLTYHMELRWPELGLELAFKPMHRGFLPGTDGTYFRHSGRPDLRTCVSFSAPLMRVQGTVTAHGRTRQVHGRGYHDHPWGTRQLFFTHARWNWARISSDRLGAMFAHVTPNHAYEGTLRFLYVGDFGEFEPQLSSELDIQEADWKKDGLLGIRSPHWLEARSGSHDWALNVGEALLDTPIYNRSRVTWGPADDAADGRGWLEYFKMPAALPRLAFWGARALAFFWRPFPWFGR